MTKSDKNSSKVEDPGVRYYTSSEEQELARLKEAMHRTDEEKFYFLMHLMKTQEFLKKGTIHHKE